MKEKKPVLNLYNAQKIGGPHGVLGCERPPKLEMEIQIVINTRNHKEDTGGHRSSLYNPGITDFFTGLCEFQRLNFHKLN